jgi:hypothetical protein
VLALKKTALPKSAAGQAANYTLSFWSKLTVFLKHPELELSTNLAENSIRPIAIGRRNWLHLGSKEPGQRSPPSSRSSRAVAGSTSPSASTFLMYFRASLINPSSPRRTNSRCIRRQTGKLRSPLRAPNVNLVVARMDTLDGPRQKMPRG